MEFANEKDNRVTTDDENAIAAVVTIVEDEVMGRCLVSKGSHAVGSDVFSDRTVIYASNDEDDNSIEERCCTFLSQHQKKKTKPKVTIDRVKAFITALAEDDSGIVQSVDTARNFLQAVVLMVQQLQGITPEGASVQMLTLIQALGPVRQEECSALISRLRSMPAHKHILPHTSILSDEMAGRLLGVMNNNQLQLEMFEGSGIFPFACILQHDCRPNCSFSSSLDGCQCVLTAIRDINAGDRISIDYGNNFYHPVRTRQKHLNHAYGFVCLCEACTCGEDPFRAFCCPECRSKGLEGVMYAQYPKAIQGAESGVALETVEDELDSDGWQEVEDDEEACHRESAGEDVVFKCTRCSHCTDVVATQALLDAEDHLCLNPPETHNELKSLLEGGVFHSLHYMCFWLIDDIAMTLALDGQEVNPKSAHSREKIRTSIDLVNDLLQLLAANPGVPTPHPEEVIFLDRQAQLHVMVGNVDEARKCYEAALIKSRVCAGATAASTLELKALAENTPPTAAALTEHYRHRRPNS